MSWVSNLPLKTKIYKEITLLIIEMGLFFKAKDELGVKDFLDSLKNLDKYIQERQKKGDIDKDKVIYIIYEVKRINLIGQKINKLISEKINSEDTKKTDIKKFALYKELLKSKFEYLEQLNIKCENYKSQLEDYKNIGENKNEKK